MTSKVTCQCGAWLASMDNNLILFKCRGCKQIINHMNLIPRNGSLFCSCGKRICDIQNGELVVKCRSCKRIVPIKRI